MRRGISSLRNRAAHIALSVERNLYRGNGDFNVIEMTAKKHVQEEEAQIIGDTLGITWDRFDVDQFRRGMDVELEHGARDPHTNVTNDDLITTGKIALAHLNEFPDYYDRLEKMEREAEEYWEEKKRRLPG
jgi:hypothetical protein